MLLTSDSDGDGGGAIAADAAAHDGGVQRHKERLFLGESEERCLLRYATVCLLLMLSISQSTGAREVARFLPYYKGMSNP